jgi:hypothetical protein
MTSVLECWFFLYPSYAVKDVAWVSIKKSGTPNAHRPTLCAIRKQRHKHRH